MKRRWDVFAEEALVIFSLLSPAPSALGESGDNPGHAGDANPNRPILEEPAVGTIAGKVERLVGDLSPGQRGLPAGKHQPVAARVYLFQGKIASGALPSKDDPRIARVVRADKSGRFSVDLPAGTYTLFFEIDGKLYRDETDGLGNWASVTVSSGKVAREDLTDRRNATF